LAFIAQQLGHSDERMVSKHYGHLAPDALATAIRTLAPQLGIAGPIKSVLSGGAAQAVDEDGKKTQKIVSQ
jgi:hypothetical protein